MMLSMFGFVVNDTLIKLVGSTMPLGQLLFVRGVFASAIIIMFAFWYGQKSLIPQSAWLWFAVRMVGELIVTFGFLTALMKMPLANATAILQLTPIVITFAAIFIFGERVGWRRWLAILSGFLGVMIVVRPGLEGFNVFSLLVLLAVIGSAIRDIATRKLPHSIGNLTITSYTSVLITLAGGILMVVNFETMVPVTTIDGIYLAASAFFILLGYFGISAAMRQGELAIVTPFRYSVYPFAILLGFAVFDELPDLMTLAGASIIILSGVVTIVRSAKAH